MKVFSFIVIILSSVFSYSFEINLLSSKTDGEVRNLLEYVNFVTEWTSYEYSGEALPAVETISHTLVQIYAYGDFVYAQAEFKGEELPVVMAVYDVKDKTIYLSDRIKEGGASEEPSLVHEMVHYLQDINGYTESLDGHLICSESEAYEVQMLWQIINGVELEKVDLVNTQSLGAARKCMGHQFR